MIGILGDSIIATCTAELSVAVLGTTIEFDYGFINNTLPAVAGTTQTNMATISSVTPSTAGEYNCIVTVTVPGVCGGGGSEPSCPSKSSDPVTLRVQCEYYEFYISTLSLFVQWIPLNVDTTVQRVLPTLSGCPDYLKMRL